MPQAAGYTERETPLSERIHLIHLVPGEHVTYQQIMEAEKPKPKPKIISAPQASRPSLSIGSREALSPMRAELPSHESDNFNLKPPGQFFK
eukprot:745817-Rhodomonas_salina.1